MYLLNKIFEAALGTLDAAGLTAVEPCMPLPLTVVAADVVVADVAAVAVLTPLPQLPVMCERSPSSTTSTAETRKTSRRETWASESHAPMAGVLPGTLAVVRETRAPLPCGAVVAAAVLPLAPGCDA